MMNLSVEEIIAKVKAANLKEFGVYHEDLADKWAAILANASDWEGDMIVAAGINNNDTDRALLAVVKEDAEKVIDGLCLAAKVLDAKEKVLYVPENETELAASIKDAAEAKGVVVKAEFINARAYRGKALHHVETMKALAEVAADAYEAGTLMAVKKAGKVGELKKVAFGTKVADIVGDTTDVKAVLIGTKFYDATGLEVVIDEDTNVGNGVITLIMANECIIDQSEKVLQIERENGCGKCTFCREGLNQLHAITKEITAGQGKAVGLEMMKEIGEAMTFSTLCSVGQTASEFVLGAMTYFENEYTDHIKKKKCTTNVCSAFMSIYIDPNTCTGCEECTDVCPVDAIEGKSGFIHMIDEFECTKCGKCIPVCEEEAIIQTTGRVPKLPTRLTKVGKFKKH